MDSMDEQCLAAKNIVIALHSALAFVLANRPLVASLVTEVWKPREHTFDVAGYAHRHHEDYMDSIEYHQEVQ
ncbi:hypothetical protein EU538_06560 [Candidatus Thorarchaeota archaeon]|nr:MAG: hypothetical protein EU538_06560 [Candidatus Thorarchaeota archaeon]